MTFCTWDAVRSPVSRSNWTTAKAMCGSIWLICACGCSKGLTVPLTWGSPLTLVTTASMARWLAGEVTGSGLVRNTMSAGSPARAGNRSFSRFWARCDSVFPPLNLSW